MANFPVGCKNCGSTNIRVRTSTRESSNTLTSIVYCSSCNACRMRVRLEIDDVQIAKYYESKEALVANKPFREIDINQLEIPTE